MRLLSAALAILFSTATLAHADTPDYGALDVHGLLDSITDAQRAKYHIAIATWKASAPGTPPGVVPPLPAIPFPHTYILGSLEGAATYNADGSIVTAGLTILPTTYVIRLPAVWNGKLIFFAPPGPLNHQFIAQAHVDLMKKGYATAMIYAALPDKAGFPYDAFIGAFRTHDVGANVFSTAHMVKDLLGAAFARPFKTYMLSMSGGTLFGAGLIVGRRGNPVDGYLMMVGGNGWRTETDEHMRAYRTDNRIPLTGQIVVPPQPQGDDPARLAAFNLAVNTEIGYADPEYRAYILRLGLVDGYKALIAYDSFTRPAAVQRAWDDLTYNPDIQAPVIVLQGTADTPQYPRNSLVFTKAVIDAGRNDRLRLYMVKDQPHMGFPIQGILDTFDQLVRWVEHGTPPGVVRFESPLYGIQDVENNWEHYPNDPCGYFHHQFDPEIKQPADCGL